MELNRRGDKAHSVIVYHNRKTSGGHSRQIFTGLSELARSGAIDLRWVERDWNPSHGTENLIKVTLDGDMDLLFDTNDGFYWIHDDLGGNIEYFAQEILPQFRYVFKRSCNAELLAKFGESSNKFRPLGLNYELTSDHNAADKFHYGWRDGLGKLLRRSDALCRVLGRTSDRLLHFENFEHPPLIGSGRFPPQILLLTRLWGPIGDDVASAGSLVLERTQHEVDAINRSRIECIEACRDAFAGNFVGGLADTPYARKVAPHLVAPDFMTDKRRFMALVKASPICIATTGLILSTGWRFGEYVAASRAIVSEKLHGVLPGSFRAPDNYLEFTTVEELLRAIRSLMDDPSALKEMMRNNYLYYRSYVRPDALVLNALLAALD
jgi:hypothetical protein